MNRVRHSSIHLRRSKIDPRPPPINIKNSVSDVSIGDTFFPSKKKKKKKKTFPNVDRQRRVSRLCSGNGKKVAFCRSPRAVHPLNNSTLRDSLDLCLERELMMHPVHPASQIEVVRAERASRCLD